MVKNDQFIKVNELRYIELNQGIEMIQHLATF